jgi:hypothetical protein
MKFKEGDLLEFDGAGCVSAQPKATAICKGYKNGEDGEEYIVVEWIRNNLLGGQHDGCYYETSFKKIPKQSNMKDLIGKKVKGFKFESRERLAYNEKMDKHIGEVGEIVYYYGERNIYKVKFKDIFWNYPADQIEAHLVDEWVVGEEYEFSNDSYEWNKRKLLAVLPERFREAKMFIVESGHLENDWTCYKYIRPIEKEDPIQKQIEKLEKELETLKKLL